MGKDVMLYFTIDDMEYNERPERYKRGVDLQKLQTAIVPSNCS
jgi:hypothetical protein